jgi:hypothetical protein
MLEAATAEGLVVVSGECSTVGLAGGYTQGEGHSALSTEFGLAADQTLSFEVVTAAGDLVTASRSENADLYGALSGGGGDNYGIVVAMVGCSILEIFQCPTTLIKESILNFTRLSKHIQTLLSEGQSYNSRLLIPLPTSSMKRSLSSTHSCPR